jgi:hypothetical protein
MLSPRTSLVLLLLSAALTPVTAVTIDQFNTALTESFDTLALVTSSTVPTDWYFSESGSSANTTYGAGTGSSNVGNTYSFGATSATDRAFGSVRTTGVAATLGTVVTNGTGSTITDLTIQFTGEQWRLGALGRTDQMDFGFSTDATSITTGTWIDVDPLDFVGPTTAGIVGALDGNAAENQVAVSYTLTGLNLLSGTSLWLRWVDFEASGSDDGLAIDNFSLLAPQILPPGDGGTPQSVPENLPTSAIVAVMVALVAVRSRHRRCASLQDGAACS